MERLLGDSERLMWTLDQVAALNFTMAAQMDGPVDEAVLRKACDLLQARHPLLGARIELRRGKPWFVSGAVGPLPLRVERRTREDQWHQEMEHEVGLAIDWTRGPLARVVLLLGEDRSDLLLTLHHTAGDGMSGVFAVRDLLRFMDALSQGKTPEADGRPERPPIEQLLPPVARGLPGLLRMLGIVARTSFVKLVQRPRTLDRWDGVPAAHRVVRVVHRGLDASETTALVETSVREGTTMHCTLCAAMLLAVARRIGRGRPAPMYVSQLSPMNLRRQLSPSVGQEVGFYVGSTTTAHRIEASTHTWELARDVRRAILKSIERDEMLVGVSLGPRMLPLRMPPAELALKLTDFYGYAIIPTNLGHVHIPKTYGPFTLSSLHFAFSVKAVPVNPFSVAACIYDGRLVLNFLGTEPFLTVEQTTALADEVVRSLRDAAGCSRSYLGSSNAAKE